MRKSIEFSIQNVDYEAYYALSEDQTRNVLQVRVRKGSRFPSGAEYRQAKVKARELLKENSGADV